MAPPAQEPNGQPGFSAWGPAVVLGSNHQALAPPDSLHLHAADPAVPGQPDAKRRRVAVAGVADVTDVTDVTSTPKTEHGEAKTHAVQSMVPRAVTVDLTDSAENSDVGGVEGFREPYEEVCYGMLVGVAVACHKLPMPKPGIQSIGGPAYWPAVKIVLRRVEADRTNTIRVYDHTRQVFGRVDKRATRCLLPLMDLPKVHLRTDARIPSRRKMETDGHVPFNKSYPVELVLYGASTFARPVWRRTAYFGLRLVAPHQVQQGVRLMLPDPEVLEAVERQRAQGTPTPGTLGTPGAVAVPGTVMPWVPGTPEMPGTGMVLGAVPQRPLAQLPSAPVLPSMQPMQPAPTYTSFQTRTMEDMRSEVMAVFDSMARADELPERVPDASVLTPLLRHQRQGLYFMMAREQPQATRATDPNMSSIWQERQDVRGGTSYYNVITQQVLQRPPPESLGGILADMMGLGKTLSILSLVASTKREAAAWRARPPEQPTDLARHKKTDAARSFDVPAPAELGLTKLQRNGRGTLLVCPLSTITNWEEQIKQHLAPGALRYHIYHGPGRTKDVAALAEFDLVITTYGSVSSELTARHRRKAGPYPLEEIGWFRIVLDEAHMIREPNTLQFKAITRLQASRRWAVTGTPVQNRLEDLGSLLAFLRLHPFHDRAKFATHIVHRFRACDPDVLPQLRVLVDSITLRRLKDKIDLPPRTDEIRRLEFTPAEKEIYDFFERDANDRVKALTSQSDRLLGGKTYIHILQAILRLRLICAHGKELLSESDLRRMRRMQQEAARMKQLGTTAESAIALDDDDDDDRNGHVKGPPSEAKLYEIYDLFVNSNSDTCVRCKRKLGLTDDASSDSPHASLKPPHDDIVGYMTPCYHVYCPDCISHFRDASRGVAHDSGLPGRCPLCNEPVLFICPEIRRDRADGEHDAPRHERDAASAAGAAADTDTDADASPEDLKVYAGAHTKTRALVADLLEHKRASAAQPDELPIKSVVFSGWTSHLDLIGRALSDNGIAYCRLDGKMTRAARTQAMDTFREDPAVHVILVSIMAGGLGLNLTAGNHVYVMEPQYNPAAEAQAIDRVHRLGQKRPVRTVRFIMDRSFEERMLEIQEDKIKLANLSLNREHAGAGGAARQRLLDLRRLFR